MRDQIGGLQRKRITRPSGDLQVGREVVKQIIEDLQHCRVAEPFAIVKEGTIVPAS